MLFKSLISLSNNNTTSKSLISNQLNNNCIEFKNEIASKSSTAFFTRPNFVNY